MFEKVLLTGNNEETLLPRVLRVLSKQGVQVRTLHMDCRGTSLSLEIELENAAAAQVAKLLAKQVAVNSVQTVA